MIKGKVGQITPESKLGKIIMDFVSRDDIVNIVEIGTWNGMGSTMCIKQSIIDNEKKNYNVLSIETNKVFYDIAVENHKPLLDNFNLIYGSIVVEKDLNWVDRNKLNLNQKSWLNEDIINISKSPFVIDMITYNIDLLILDGGEFSTYPEFQKLKNRSKYIILDDSNMLKCIKIKEEILSEPNKYDILFDEPNDRNGFFICKNKVV